MDIILLSILILLKTYLTSPLQSSKTSYVWYGVILKNIRISRLRKLGNEQKSYGVFFSTKKMCTLFQKMQGCVCVFFLNVLF